MVLLTAREVAEDSVLMMADFRDTHALRFVRSGHLVGLTKSRGMRLGSRPAVLVNGVWYLDEDPAAQDKFRGVELTEDLVDLAPIERP